MGHRYINTSRMTTHGFSVKSLSLLSYRWSDKTNIPEKEATLNASANEFYWEKAVCNVSVHFNESIKVFFTNN